MRLEIRLRKARERVTEHSAANVALLAEADRRTALQRDRARLAELEPVMNWLPKAEAIRDRIVRIDAVAEIDALGIVDYEPSAERAVSGRQELARVQRLIEALPERCRLIFTMRKIDGLPQKEIAARLRVSENIVEKEAAKGLRLVLQGLGEETGARRPFRLFTRRGRDAKADRR